MKSTIRVLALILLMGLASGSAWAGGPYIYPERGQSQQQMEQDKFDCYNWAKQQTGFDPMNPPPSVQPPPSSQPQGEVVQGAARGAALGAIGGAIGGNAGKGAAIGAATGGVFGGMRRRSEYQAEQQQYEQAVQNQQAQYQQQRGQYNRAFDACMEGRGYVVN